MELYNHTTEFWKDWKPYVMVLLSLFLQIILIFFGNWRKYTRRTWIRIVMWCTYLMADWIATVALGFISNNLRDTIQKRGSLDHHIKITAFWAPFLLLHLGGPDTITAYSLEDNELWPRHFLGLGVQSTVTLYILFMVRKMSTGFTLSIPSFLMFFAGIIKYSERTWVLRSASNDQFRDDMLTRPNVIYPNFTREYALKQNEGFNVKVDETNEEFVPVNYENNYSIDLAHYLFQNFKRLFVDLTLDFDDWYNSRFLFKEISSDDAFLVIEIELGFMYDVLYTKATIVHSLAGWIFRLISFSLTCVVLVLFSMIDKQSYKNIDLVVTFLLLSFAVFLEVCAIILLLSSDWTRVWLNEQRRKTSMASRVLTCLQLWLSMHAKTSMISRVLACLQLPKRRRWSNTISQFNLLSVSLTEKRIPCYEILNFIGVVKVLRQHWYPINEEVTEDLKQLIFQHFKDKFQSLEEISDNAAEEMKKMCSYRGGHVLQKYKHSELLDWSIKIEFNQSILIWHIATDICYHKDNVEDDIINCELSQSLSQYMLYLLVVRRFMSPVGSGVIRFHDTCADIRKSWEGHKFRNKYDACQELLKKDTEAPSSIILGDRSKSVLIKGCKLASELQAISDIDQKWEMISNVWVEMLAYAAGQLTGKIHAQQLKSGGEFLTHVWLLMAHFGLNEQFDISEGYVRAKQLTVE